MKVSLFIFFIALTIRFINLLFLDLDSDQYLIEDQKFYWEWSLKSAYLPWSEITSNILSERMPGAFLYIETLQWLTSKNLFLVLIIQSLLDSFTCVIISNCAFLINKRYKLYAGVFAACSPLLVILSSQILSDTIFLFAFVSSLYFLLKYKEIETSNNYLYLSGLMLGIATFIRAATFPFIFISLPIIYFLIKSKDKKDILKTLPVLFFFLIFSLGPVSPRLYDNIINNNTYSLTSQTGSHMAYWMVPGVLSISNKYDREHAIKLVNSKLDMEEGLTGNAYQDSRKMVKASLEILSNQNIINISYSWLRASILNTITPAILIDKRVRDMAHPSFAQNGNIKIWLNSLLFNNEYFLYKNFMIISFFLAIFSSISLAVGFYIFYKKEKVLSVIAFLIIFYFCLITGPTLSPKYCLPYVPVIFYLQSLFIDKLIIFFKKRK